ncbi:hypothetical protein CLOM_g134 [Closterium sp. NIES-68]|nr:hypothetical protein CLOM_g134 [Closterium sp. NIES-68]
MGGKSKGKGKKATESPSPAQSPQPSRHAANSPSTSRAESSSSAQMPACFDNLFGGKRLELKISAIDDMAARDTSAAAQIWLHPAAMTADDVAAGDMVAVVCIDPQSAQPIPPLQLAQEALQLATPDWTQHPSWPAIAARLPGLYCALATVWPSPKIHKSCCRLSWPLADSLGRPEEDTRLYVLTPRIGRQQNLNPNLLQIHGERGAVQPIPCRQLALTWLEPLACCADADMSAESDRSAAGAAGGEGGGGEAATPHKTPAAAAAASSLTSPVPCTPPRSTQRPLSSSSSSPFPTSSPSPSPSPHTPSNAAQRLEPRTPGSAKKVSTPGSAATLGSAKKTPYVSEEEMERARWAAVKTLVGQTEGNEGNGSGSSRDKKDPQGLRLVEVFAARWLLGRVLLPGNIVVVPVCGQDCCFVVSHGTVAAAEAETAANAVAKIAATAAAQAASAAALETRAPLQVGPLTAVVISSPSLAQEGAAAGAGDLGEVRAVGGGGLREGMAAGAAAPTHVPPPPFLLAPVPLP